MKSNTPPILRAVYIILVPVVLLIILLNSGWLQRFLPAATVNGESYSVVRYNFYYFDYYNSFLEENEDRLDELGYDPQKPDSEQSYDGTMTWKEFFMAAAEESLAETAYYNALAREAGYVFSSEELSPVDERLAAEREFYTSFGLSAGNYYVSYYGAGMDLERYTQELTLLVKGQAYKSHLTAEHQPAQAELDAWLSEAPQAEYLAADLRVITLNALPHRGTGEVGEPQLAALEQKLQALADRYEQGVPFAELQAAFSTCALGDETGALPAATAGQLPKVLAGWCLEGQDGLAPGDTWYGVDREAGVAYFAVLDGFAGSGPELEARASLAHQAVEDQWQSRKADYQVERSSIGMLLATG